MSFKSTLVKIGQALVKFGEQDDGPLDQTKDQADQKASEVVQAAPNVLPNVGESQQEAPQAGAPVVESDSLKPTSEL